jgi:GWxTD domain-containing protein
MRGVWDGLQYLLSSNLQRQFLGLSNDDLRAEWLRRYWRLRDPTPTTAENERQREHERRVIAAKSCCAWKEAPGWDDRGAIRIRFGDPDSIIEEVAIVEDGRGFVPGRQDWLYLDDKWVAQFERPNPKGPWKLGRSSARLSYRPDLVSRDRQRLGYDPSLEPPTPSNRDRASDLISFNEDRARVAEDPLYERYDAELLRHEVRTDFRSRDLLRRKDEALLAFTKQYESGGERFTIEGTPRQPLWYVFDVDVFKGPPGRMRVEVHYQLSLADLEFAWRDSLYLASYRAEGVLLDREAREAGRDEYTESIKTDEFRTTLVSQLVPGQLVFSVPEGSYRLGLRLIDPASERQGTYLTDVEVPRLDGRSLALSDLQMATSIVYAGDDWRSRFVKNDRLVVPNPIKAYTRGKQMVGYYEIYGLTLDTNRACRYEVQYTIAPRSLGRYEGVLPPEGTFQKPFVTSSFTDEGGSSDLVQELRVDIGALGSDTYDLVLKVRDLVSGSEATSRTRFSIVN